MRTILIAMFGAILACMLAVTTYASLERSVFQAGMPLLSDRWFQATLCDAYFGFLTFYVWVAYRERRWPARLIWFVLIMTLGNIAMSAYVLIRLFRLKPGEGWAEFLLREGTVVKGNAAGTVVKGNTAGTVVKGNAAG
jgi:hypothetical protein